MSRRDFSDCMIGEGAKVDGTIDAPGMVRIDGEFSGDIKSAASVIISKNAIVHAHINARQLLVAGIFTGSAIIEGGVRYAETARIEADSGSAIIEGGVRYAETARIEADCTGRFFVVEAGALVNGQFSRIDAED